MESNLKNVMFEAADQAAEILVNNFGKNFEIGRKKDYNDLVTEIDRQSEKKIIEVIHQHYPEHNILGEEGGDNKKKSDYRWIIDPIDGTINFTHKLPLFCISIALEIKGVISIGLVQAPLTGEKFWAEIGGGAFLNGKRIHVSSTENLADALLVTGFPYGARHNIRNCIDHFVNFVKLGLPIRRLGSAALDLCYLACGRFDAFWEVNLNPWDVAAGYLIVKEAGGRVTDFSGNEYSVYMKEILASNGRTLHEEMIDVLSGRH
jgi:myo-inositol-1(or 4)-monophosphatase